MKRNLKFIAALLMMVISLSSFAKTTVNPLKDYSSNHIVLSYLEASTIGNNVLNKYLFSSDFQYINTVNNSKSSKKEYLKFLESTKGLVYDCESSYEILDQSGKTAIAKTTMKFKNFTRIEILTLNQSVEGWKITQIVSSIKL